MLSFLPPDVTSVPLSESAPEPLDSSWPRTLQVALELAREGLSDRALADAKTLEKAARAEFGSVEASRAAALPPSYDELYRRFGGAGWASKGSSAALRAALKAMSEAAQDLRVHAADSNRRGLHTAAAARDLDDIAGRWYSALSAVATSEMGRLWSGIEEIAAKGRQAALRWMSELTNGEGWEAGLKLQDDGDFASAVLGATLTKQLRGMLRADQVTWGRRVRLNTYQGGLLDDLAGLVGPLVVGAYTTRHLLPDPKHPSFAQAWAVGRVYVFLRSTSAAGLLRAPMGWAEQEDTREAWRRILDGHFSLDVDRTQGILMGKVYSWGDSYGLYPAVPLGAFNLYQLRQDEVDNREQARIVEELARSPWNYLQADRSTKKSEVVKGYATDKQGYLKWIKPDPFRKA